MTFHVELRDPGERTTAPVPREAVAVCLTCGYYFLAGEERERCPCGTPRFEDYATVWAREHPEEATRGRAGPVWPEPQRLGEG